jgi:hypothetical protein
MTFNPLQNSVYGYYQVGNQFYMNKAEALFNATKNNQPATWHFHEDVYSSIDWTKRPDGTLEEMYKERAQRLRDKYDYLILLFSGGMDSWTVLDTFLKNNIHIDEIVTRWPRAERKFVKLSKNPEQINMGSEYELTVYPVLKYVEKNFPKIKITVDDFSECFNTELTEKDFLTSNAFHHMPTFFKYNRSTDAELEQVKLNKSIGLVTGAEKIHMISKNNNLYAFFTDQSNGSDSNPNRKVEFFYWSIDAPLIPVLQSHYLSEFLIEKNAVNPAEIIPTYLNRWRRVYQQCCYPNYNMDTFQVKKQFGSLVWQSDAWTYKYNPAYYHSWKWVTNQYFDHIDEQYITRLNNALNSKPDSPNMIVGLNLFNSPLYLVKENAGIPDFKR